MLDSELAREKMWSRIHLIPLLTAEEDRDLVRRHFADQAREKALLGSVTSPYNTDKYVYSEGYYSLLCRKMLTFVQICSPNLCSYPSFANAVDSHCINSSFFHTTPNISLLNAFCDFYSSIGPTFGFFPGLCGFVCSAVHSTSYRSIHVSVVMASIILPANINDSRLSPSIKVNESRGASRIFSRVLEVLRN